MEGTGTPSFLEAHRPELNDESAGVDGNYHISVPGSVRTRSIDASGASGALASGPSGPDLSNASSNGVSDTPVILMEGLVSTEEVEKLFAM